jgi:hypothetical protein
MGTALLERSIGSVGLHARCLESAIHRPDGWTLYLDGEIYGPVSIEITQDESIISATWVAGPMPEGLHVVALHFAGAPMIVSEMDFKTGSWWKHKLSSHLR